jgi:serine protease AprX
VIKPSQGRSVITENVTPGLKTGGAWQRTIRLPGSARLRVVLAYSDFPGAALVNNLNLMVTGPDGSWYVGNQTKAGALALDATNNVEMIDIPVARSGAWRIDVIGANVPEGPQDFALVIIGRVA